LKPIIINPLEVLALRQWLEEEGERMSDHRRDEDCTIDPATDTCSVCGVGHGEPCPDCGARAFHRRGCFQWTRAQRQAVKDSLRGMEEQ